MANRMGLYLSIVFGVYACAAAALVTTSAILWRSGDLWPSQWIASHQISRQSLWNAAVQPDEAGYKRALYLRREADIVVFGSSRVLQLREGMFRSPFINMGRAFEFEATPASYRQAAAVKRPKLVLWGLDYWEFAQSNIERRAAGRRFAGLVNAKPIEDANNVELIPRYAATFWTLLRSGSISPADVGRALLPADTPGTACIGLRACGIGDGGYASDGSYYYLKEIRRPHLAADTRAQEVQRMQNTRSAYSILRHDRVSAEALKIVRDTIAEMRRDSVVVYLFLSPVAPGFATILQTYPEFSPFISDLRKALTELSASLDVKYFDFLDPDTVPARADEFYDSIHPAASAMAKILQRMSGTGNDLLKSVVNAQRLRELASTPAWTFDIDGFSSPRVHDERSSAR